MSKMHQEKRTWLLVEEDNLAEGGEKKVIVEREEG